MLCGLVDWHQQFGGELGASVSGGRGEPFGEKWYMV